MNDEEKQIQDALGLLKTYSGYVKVQGRTHYDVYEIQDVTMDGASAQLNRIVEKAQKKSKVPLKLVMITDDMERPYADWGSSNPKS